MRRSKGRRGKGVSREKKKTARRKKPQRARTAQPYAFLDHPADVGFRVRGRTLAALFAAAAEAMCAYGWELNRVKARAGVALHARAATLEDLLFSWLSEVLFLCDAEGWVFKEFIVHQVKQTRRSGEAATPAAGQASSLALSLPKGRPFSEASRSLWEVRGEARGEKFDRRRHRARTYIKAVTYHQLKVAQRAGAWHATVYLDV